MITLNKFKYIYFIGIGGIGMSALARYFNQNGYQVSGYDKTSSNLTDLLISEGISISFEDKVSIIKAEFTYPSDCLVIYTPAIPNDSIILDYFNKGGFQVIKRSVLLALMAEGKTCIAVAGTHGKTSTTTMAAHLLKSLGVNFLSFLGGISSNYSTNFIFHQNNGQNQELILLEADEYDRSFHRLYPESAVITAIEPDHLDIYGTFENLQEAYSQFANQVNGDIWIQKDFEFELDVPKNKSLKTYSASSKKSGAYADNIEFKNGSYYFDYVQNDSLIEEIELPTPGRHNVENTVAAISLILPFIKGDKSEEIKSAIKNYKGVKRRFEIIISNQNQYYVDDYAHHPTEIKVTLETLKEMFPERKLVAIFQPHLFSRTKDLAAEFAQSLSLADDVILLPIYPARELPMEGVTSQLIADGMDEDKVRIIEKAQLLEYLTYFGDINLLVTLGAGDIDRFITPIKNILTKNN